MRAHAAMRSAMLPTVSVLLPTYDRAGHLPAAIESVLAQSFTDFELIVVDDGSSDGTDGVLARIDDRRLPWCAARMPAAPPRSPPDSPSHAVVTLRATTRTTSGCRISSPSWCPSSSRAPSSAWCTSAARA